LVYIILQIVNAPSLKWEGGMWRGMPGPSITRNRWAQAADAPMMMSRTTIATRRRNMSSVSVRSTGFDGEATDDPSADIRIGGIADCVPDGAGCRRPGNEAPSQGGVEREQGIPAERVHFPGCRQAGAVQLPRQRQRV